MNFHAKIMNIQADELQKPPEQYTVWQVYKAGHRDARHAAAEIANESDAEIDQLRTLCKELAEALTDARKTSKFERHPFRAWHSDADKALAKYKQLIEPTKRV